MTEWSQAVWIAIGLILGAFILSIMVGYLYIGRNINNEISRQEGNRVMMQEYREYNGFNNKVVYSQDIVSLVLKERGEVGVRVLRGTSLLSYWCDDPDLEDSLETCDEPWSLNNGAKQTTYTATAVQEKLDVDKVYLGSLTYGPNGEVMGVTFKRGTVDNNGNFISD